MVAHEMARQRLVAQYDAIPAGAPVRLAKRTSNLFRPRDRTAAPGLDVAGLDSVLSVDPVARTADVQAMTTYEQLVDATLAHGLMPAVVPQLKTITIGGAFTGLGIESSSFRNGLPHESVREIEVLTGDGAGRGRRPRGSGRRPVPGLPQLLRHPRLRAAAGDRPRAGAPVRPAAARALPRPRRADRGDRRRSSPTQPTTGSRSTSSTAPCSPPTRPTSRSAPGPTRRRTPPTTPGSKIYYRSIQQRTVDYLTVRDYLWRWDTDWFWCSRAFGAQNPRIRRLWPKRWLRSDVYWKLIRLENRYHVAARLDARKGLPPRERVVQDVEIPLERTADFLRWFLREVPIEPVWLCPLRLRDAGADRAVLRGRRRARRGRSTRCAQGETYVNVGFWSTVAIEGGRADGDVNRQIEAVVAEHGGHKSLYSDAYYGAGRVLGSLRRRGLPRGEEALRPAVPAARPLCEGGEATMTFKLDTSARTRPVR